MDKLIDELMDQRAYAERMGYAQNEEDSMLLLALLLEDAKRNPQNYVRR